MSITKVGPFGGRGEWDDGSYDGVKQLTIHFGTVIDCVQVEYEKDGKSVWSSKHGGTGGHNYHEVKLDYPNEFIISISGHHHPRKNVANNVIYSLTIETNKRKYGPFGTEKGETFLMSGTNSKIIGLYGVSGIYLDSIGAYLKPIALSVPHHSLGPFGGEEGHEWDDGVNNGIKQIEIGAYDVIDNIRIEYDKNGNSFWSDKHGDSNGGINLVIKLDYPEEFITSISGHFRNYEGGPLVLSSFKIESNKKTYGPFGKEIGSSFSTPASGGKIIGFHGRSSKLIDAIGVHVEPIINMNNKYQSVGPFGGFSGQIWDDGVNCGIKHIEITYGEIINSLRVEYNKNGNLFWSVKHGESIGDKKVEVELDYPNEFIVAISGYQRFYATETDSGYNISSLTFQTNKKTYGPYGKEEGHSFTFPKSGEKIVGFHGKSGTFINAIGGHWLI